MAAAAKTSIEVVTPALEVMDIPIIGGMAFIHPNGAVVARKALAAGMDPDNLTIVNLHGRDEMMPALMFKVAPCRFRTFTPQGEMV